MIYILIFYFISQTFEDTLGQAPCSSYVDKLLCEGSNYCLWDINYGCQAQLCHLIKEISACRFSGFLINSCSVIEYIPPSLELQCYIKGYVSTKVYFVKHSSDLTYTQIDYTSTLISILSNKTPQIQNLQDLYQLDVLSRNNDELMSILIIYINHSSYLLQKQSHPYYIERIIYESLENIRDDLTITISQKMNTFKIILSFIDLLYQRLETFSEFYYTQYYSIFFNFVHLKYLTLTFSNIITLSWDSYEQNGFLSLTVLYLEIFGYNSPVSPCFIIKTSNGINLTYKIKWTLTTTDAITFQVVNLNNLQFIDTQIMPICSGGYCEVTVTGSGNYIFTSNSKSDQCSSLSRTQCKLKQCTYNYNSDTCQ